MSPKISIFEHKPIPNANEIECYMVKLNTADIFIEVTITYVLFKFLRIFVCKATLHIAATI